MNPITAVPVCRSSIFGLGGFDFRATWVSEKRQFMVEAVYDPAAKGLLLCSSGPERVGLLVYGRVGLLISCILIDATWRDGLYCRL